MVYDELKTKHQRIPIPNMWKILILSFNWSYKTNRSTSFLQYTFPINSPSHSPVRIGHWLRMLMKDKNAYYNIEYSFTGLNLHFFTTFSKTPLVWKVFSWLYSWAPARTQSHGPKCKLAENCGSAHEYSMIVNCLPPTSRSRVLIWLGSS